MESVTQSNVMFLPLEKPTAENLAPFGEIIGPSAGVEPTSVDFYKGKIKMGYPADFSCDHPVKLTLASMERRPFEVRYMERHFEHTQSFIPLNGKPFVAFLAPPNDEELPSLKDVRAFLFDGSEGFCMKRGTWHEFPFATENDTQMIVLLSSQTGYDLADVNPETEEAFGPDLDKKDLSQRTGISFRIEEADIVSADWI